MSFANSGMCLLFIFVLNPENRIIRSGNIVNYRLNYLSALRFRQFYGKYCWYKNHKLAHARYDMNTLTIVGNSRVKISLAQASLV